MIIRGSTVYVYDVETFPNVFTCTIKNSETEGILTLEISERKNDLDKIIRFFKYKPNTLICGYNNIHYDNILINFLIDEQSILKFLPWYIICEKLFSLSSKIVNSENSVPYKKWKYSAHFKTLDLLTMLYSQKLRTGLKELQVTMQYPNVQEYEGNFNEPLAKSEIDKMIEYNINDVNSTCELLNRCKKEIDLRLGIEDEFGVDVLSKDGMSIGTEILKTKYLEKTGKSWCDIKDLRSPCDVIDLKDVIFPVVHFETPLLQNFLEEFRNQKVGAGRKAYEKHFLLDDLEYSVGVGGKMFASLKLRYIGKGVVY